MKRLIVKDGNGKTVLDFAIDDACTSEIVANKPLVEMITPKLRRFRVKGEVSRKFRADFDVEIEAENDAQAKKILNDNWSNGDYDDLLNENLPDDDYEIYDIDEIDEDE